MYCTQCGKKAGADDRFCAGCGHEMGPSSVVTDEANKNPVSSQQQELSKDFPPLATRREYFRDISDKQPVVFDFPDLSLQSLALVDIIFTSERVVFLPCERSRWDSGHLMLLGAVGGPIGLLVAGGAGALWQKVTKTKSEKDFDGGQLDKLVRSGLALSAANSDLEIALQQVSRGIALPGTWITYGGLFTFGSQALKGRIDSTTIGKSEAVAKELAKVSAIRPRRLPELVHGNWNRISRTGKYLESIGCKSEFVVMRRMARKIPFPLTPDMESAT